MGRLRVVDEIFLRTHRGLGTPIALQGLWRTADRVEPALLAQVHSALRSGPLGRRVSRPRVPGARRSWQRNTRAHQLVSTEGVLSDAALMDWADAQGSDIDPESVPGWRLSTAGMVDGGSVVALTCSHALADGRALVFAVDRALGDPHPEVPESGASESEWFDALRQWSIVLRGTAAAIRRGIPRNPAVTTRAPEPTIPTGPVTHSAILQCPAPEWDRAAATTGGTANSLFIQLVVTILWHSGFPNSTIEASLPIDTRDEPRVDNDLAMTAIAVSRSDTPATIRASARFAYERRIHAPGGMPAELLQVIPDRWAHALSKGAGERDILCSNIGTLPARLRALGPHRCTGVAARAIHPDLTAARLPRTRLSGYLCRIGDDYVLSLVGLDPARIESAAALRELALHTTTSAGLSAYAW
ncbi:hypothetical protein AB0B25_02790 [Nocardia sp. NPDC049190]|uniref:hypothetical protein n=1 Tax=Nocardia sp. NPDC049190 TaxID=3155650 RepID=UPI0033E46069